MINGSFVFGLDDDDQSVFTQTVEWAIEKCIDHMYFSYSYAISGNEAF
jgi:hypothetical protein